MILNPADRSGSRVNSEANTRLEGPAGPRRASVVTDAAELALYKSLYANADFALLLTLWPFAKAKRVAEVDRIPIGKPIEVEPPGEPDGIFLGKPPRPRIVHPVPHVLEPGPALLVLQDTPVPHRERDPPLVPILGGSAIGSNHPSSVLDEIRPENGGKGHGQFDGAARFGVVAEVESQVSCLQGSRRQFDIRSAPMDGSATTSVAPP